MSSQRHIIKRQILELEHHREAASDELQQRLSRLFRDRLLPIISQTLDRYSPPNVLHRIEKLEINLEEIRLSQLDQEVEERFRIQFQSALQEALRKLPKNEIIPQEQFGKQTVGKKDQSMASISGKKEQSSLSPTSSVVSAGSAVELFRYFMQNGILPWWADQEDPKLLPKVFAQLGEQRPDWLREKLLRYFHTQQYRRRFLAALPTTSIQQSLNILIPTKQMEMLEILALWFDGIPQLANLFQQSPASFRHSSWEAAVYLVLEAPKRRLSRLKVVQSMALLISGDLNIGIAPFLEGIQKSGMFELSNEEWRQLRSGRSFSEQTSPIEIDTNSTARHSTDKSTQQKKEADSFSDSEEIYITNAGLVILWVFLQRFFEGLGLVQEKAFISPEAQNRALLLLQYLADGSIEAPEYLLPLNKLFCGMEITEAPLPQDPLTEEEQNICEELLSAVIANAPVLGKISNEGFRHTFLLREGVLKRQGPYWLLRVQRETFDIVLDRLLWPCNYVKLPWMGTAIRVEW